MSKLYVVVGTLITLVAIGVLGFALCTSSIRPGEVGIPVVLGKPTGDVWQSGLHWRVPFVTKVVRYKTLARSYETSDNPKDSGANYTDYPITAQTVDGQQIKIKTTTLFKVSPENPIGVLTGVGDMDAVVENVVKAHTRNLVRLYAQSYSAEALYSGDGIFEFQEQVSLELHDELGQRGVHLDDFLLRKIDFDEEYVAVIEDQQQAKERIETAQYEADAAEYEKQKRIREAEADAERMRLEAIAAAERTVVQAQANADQQRLEADSLAYWTQITADADAYSTLVNAEAQAEALRVKGEQLTKYPNLIEFEFVKNFEGVEWGLLPSDGVLQFLPLDQMLPSE